MILVVGMSGSLARLKTVAAAKHVCGAPVLLLTYSIRRLHQSKEASHTFPMHEELYRHMTGSGHITYDISQSTETGLQEFSGGERAPLAGLTPIPFLPASKASPVH